MFLKVASPVGPDPARYVRHNQMCPQLYVSDKNGQTNPQDPTKLDVSDTNSKTTQDTTELDVCVSGVSTFTDCHMYAGGLFNENER